MPNIPARIGSDTGREDFSLFDAGIPGVENRSIGGIRSESCAGRRAPARRTRCATCTCDDPPSQSADTSTTIQDHEMAKSRLNFPHDGNN